MPLYRGKSESDFKHNVKTEHEEGKPLKQSLAIAYAMKRRGKKMADGGFVREEEESGYRPMPMEHPKMDRRAEEEDDRRLNQHGMYEVGAGGMAHGGMMDGYQDDSDDMDMIDHIMRQKSDCYSEGGRVANQEHGPDDNDMADFEPNEFDDMVKDDDLSSSYTGANSGDEIGNEQEDEDQHDMIGMIMRERGKKDRMPIPGYGTSYGRNK